jgi:phenylalanyl-tRNA synthetase beta chain
MKVTWNWLSELVELDVSPAELAERLTMAGLEVEGVERLGDDLAAVVCAEIVHVDRHPQADRLSICQVRRGGDGTVTVVCGAPNVAAGQRVAYAPPGARLPGGAKIEQAEIRGVASAGMLCSEAELGLGTDASGILVLGDDAPIGERVARVIGFEDTVLEVAITPNRGDCLAVLGLAREIAALAGQRLRRTRIAVPESAAAAADLIAISIEDPELCRRYAGRIIDGLHIGPSPLWMQCRLRAVGMRPINNVVDVTNYVMMERGQPLHAFDYQRLPKPEIAVRRARDVRSMITLDGQDRRLEHDDLLITSGGEAVAIAGVMGGANSEVDASTQRVLLESAWFDPGSVRRTSKRLGLRSEASYRFERTTDIEGVVPAADRAMELMARLAGGEVRRGCVDVYPAPLQPAPIVLRLKRVENVLGKAIEKEEVSARLKAFGMNVAPATSGTLTVVPPSYRADVSREIDLIEELARCVGYDNVDSTLPECTLGGSGLASAARRERDLKRFLAGLGMTEAVLLSFCSPAENALFPAHGGGRRPVVIRNPLSQEDSQLRLSLCPGLLRAARENLNQGNGHTAAFALAKVFWEDGGFAETRRLGGAVCPGFPARGIQAAKQRRAEFGEMKGLLETVFDFLRVSGQRWLPAADMAAFHPGKTARIELSGSTIGYLGLLHPNVAETQGVDANCWLFELDLEKVLEYCPARAVFKELPRFPVVVRDVAFLTDSDFQSARVVDFVHDWKAAQGLVEAVELFDCYAGEGIPANKKSLAYSISYRAPDRTLTDVEVNDAHADLVAALIRTFGIQQR